MIAIIESIAFADPIVGGGWGVDALVGRPTRSHDDLDLAVDAGALDRAVAALRARGFEVTTDWLPVRLELTHDDGSVVDLHPVEWNAHGDGVQQGTDGRLYLYPRGDLVTGTIDGAEVRCISAALQRSLHDGYELSDKDRHDLAQLDALG